MLPQVKLSPTIVRPLWEPVRWVSFLFGQNSILSFSRSQFYRKRKCRAAVRTQNMPRDEVTLHSTGTCHVRVHSANHLVCNTPGLILCEIMQLCNCNHQTCRQFSCQVILGRWEVTLGTLGGNSLYVFMFPKLWFLINYNMIKLIIFEEKNILQ